MIAVCSVFRDNASDVERCFADRAAWHVDHDRLIHVCVEGDSVDGTHEALLAMSRRHKVIVIKFDTGKPRYPSQIIPERMQVLGRTSNVALDAVLALPERPTHIMWLDSDVSTHPDMVPLLLQECKDMIAPMFYFDRSVFFRDTWGYRSMNGDEFANRPKYDRNFSPKRPFEVSSVGLPLIDTRVIEAGARFSEADEIVGLCRHARTLGFKIFCHPHVTAWHPRMPGIEIPRIYER